jgi:gentisate 1,2-dioxygenase
MTRIFSGGRTPSIRRTGSTIYVVLHGRGRSVVDGIQLDWGPGDIFVSPSWAAVDHEADEQADVFMISDRPVLQSFRLYREETLPEAQVVDEVFSPR